MLRQSNKAGFGDEIGSTTNKITAMYDVQSDFAADSEKYKALEYRIQCGQLYQQNCIDKIKGIKANSMPKYWYTRQRNPYNDKKIEFENRIAATLKPYFMIYIYPQLRDEYNEYIKKTNIKCVRVFGVTYKDLLEKKRKNKAEKEFIANVNKYLPVTDKQSVMNRLCHIVEEAFDGYTSLLKSQSDFNPDVFKSGAAYSLSNYKAISELYSMYQQDVQKFAIQNQTEHLKQEDMSIQYQCLFKEYKRLCIEACPDETELCDILVDLCYNTEKSKQFVWEVCGDTIIQNLLSKHNNTMTYIERDDNGNIEYSGYRFSKREKRIGE